MAKKITQKPTTLNQSFLSDWILPLIFLFTLPPVGLAIGAYLFFTAGAREEKIAREQAEPKPAGSRTTVSFEARAAAKSAPFDPVGNAEKKVRKLAGLGAVMALLFAAAFALLLPDALKMLPDATAMVNRIITPACFALCGVLMFLDAARKRKKVRRYRRYLSALSRSDSVTISALARATGRSTQQVRGDLREMLNNGQFLDGYLDRGGDVLIPCRD